LLVAAGGVSNTKEEHTMQTLPVIPVETLAPALRSTRNGNPGIVPPWLQHPHVGPDQPVADDVPRILGAMQPTVYEPLPIVIDDELPRIMRFS
jgi:hypothetical protein